MISFYIVDFDSFSALKHDPLVSPDSNSLFIVGFSEEGDLACVLNYKTSSFFGGAKSYSFVSIEVLPEFRNNGVMTKTLDYFIDVCKKMGVSEVQITDYTDMGAKYLRETFLQKTKAAGISLIEESNFTASDLLKQYLD